MIRAVLTLCKQWIGGMAQITVPTGVLSAARGETHATRRVEQPPYDDLTRGRRPDAERGMLQ